MRSTRYLDPAGLDNGTVSTAADQLRVTADAMTDPTFAAIVAEPTVTLPLAGTLPNYVKAVGTYGIVGVKSGFTQAAMGCLVLAVERSVAGRKVLVLAAVTGQPPPTPLDAAEQADLQLVDAVSATLHDVNLITKGAVVGRVMVPWARRPVPAVVMRGLTLMAWPGQAVHMTVTTSGLAAGSLAGAPVGMLSVSVGRHHVRIPVRLTDGLPGPSMRWRLAHG
jgi:D-alanyl-D-alanine carboxypeptidase (penicillin-binding protein 5/6)